jgi:hypothetical protein
MHLLRGRANMVVMDMIVMVDCVFPRSAELWTQAVRVQNIFRGRDYECGISAMSIRAYLSGCHCRRSNASHNRMRQEKPAETTSYRYLAFPRMLGESQADANFSGGVLCDLQYELTLPPAPCSANESGVSLPISLAAWSCA